MNQTHRFASSSAAICFVALATSARAQEAVPAPSAAWAGAVPEGLSAVDWLSIRAAYEAGRRAVSTCEEGYRARHPGQQWMTHFDGRGFTTTPDAGGWEWGLELESFGFSGAERGVEGRVPASAEGARVAYAWDAALEEWYVNGELGLEHGYTVHVRPGREGEAAGPLCFTLAVRGGLRPEVQREGRDVQFLADDGEPVITYTGLVAFDAEGRNLPAWLESEAHRLRLVVREEGARYPVTIDPIAQQAYLKASNTGWDDRFGDSVSISRDTVIVGAPKEDSDSTGVNGNQLNNHANDSGAAYVFVRNGPSWSQQAYLKASNTDASDAFGDSVSISGDTVIVGAPWEDSAATGVNGDESDDSAEIAGAAYVFVRRGTSWSQQAYLKASNAEAGDLFGGSVSVSGDTVVVGASIEDSNATGVDGDESNDGAWFAGAAYVFVRNGTSWSQQAYLKASNPRRMDFFGASVSVSEDTVAVGAPREDSGATGVNGDQSDGGAADSGAAYVFVREGTSWSQQAYLKATNTGAFDYLGTAVSVSGDTVVLGASYEDSHAAGVNGDQGDENAPESGAAYVFVRDGTTWSYQAYLKASNTSADDRFGEALSVSGDILVIGAPGEDKVATGVNGDQTQNGAPDSGAAYVFVRNANVWSQRAYLKASNTEAYDLFGSSVSVSSDTVVVGAWREASNATGVDGDESDDSLDQAGAAYVFDLDSPGDPGTGICFGDGSGTACPCGNESAQVAGCANSTGVGGALRGWGSDSVAADDLVLLASSALPSQPGVFFQGDSAIAGGAGEPFGDGLRCAGGNVVRLEIVVPDDGGDASSSVNIAAAAGSAAGDLRHYQYWYRDPAGGPCGTGFNLSNALSVTWAP